MTQPNRLAAGGLIDRRTPLTFTFDGVRYQGYAGDTLASALLANGVKLLARSFKYHRPRGLMAAGVEEPNVMVQLEEGARSIPDLKATEIALYDGLTATSVNVWPSRNFDVGAIGGWFSRFLAAGFYYKAFFGSPWLWQRVIEPVLRRGAGWGKAPEAPDPDVYDQMHHHCDVLVVGGGAAGLMAALAAGRSGARVILAEQDARFGGSLLGRSVSLEDTPPAQWADGVLAELRAMPEVRLLARTTVFGYYDQNYLCALERRTDHLGPQAGKSGHARQRLWHIRAGRVVLATGAHERPLVFAQNDRPGTMLAGAVSAYINRWAVLPGRRAVVVVNNDRAYETALDLHGAGAAVTLVDVRPDPAGPLVEAVRKAGIAIFAGHGVTATRGRKAIRRARIQRVSADGRSATGRGRWLDCDLLASSGGSNPIVHLFSQSKGRLDYDDKLACFRPGEGRRDQAVAGACNAVFSLKATLEDGLSKGRAAAQAAGFAAPDNFAAPRSDERPAQPPAPAWLIPDEDAYERGKAKHFVDFQNDTTAADIRLSVREGFESVEHMKRFTLAGFGTDQGKLSHINPLAILAETLAKPIPEVGTTTFRPPYTAVTFAAMAGRNRGEKFDPARLTPMQDWHVASGAVFEDVGQWKRPRYYPASGEDMRSAVARECRAARDGVGLLDASTLGKIDIQGPDAAEFLNRVYTNSWTRLPVGRLRYGVMCKEDGMVFDDGTTARLDENRYLMTTTTGGAAGVLDHLEEYLQTEWPDLRVRLTSVTEQWAVASIAGPKSRAVLARLVADIDLSGEAFPFLTWQDAAVAGLPARIFRVSFTGELQYEVNVPWRYGPALWDALMAAGAEWSITPYGTETMHVLRAEKGFIIAGQETDGTQTPIDLGLGWAVSKKKDFIGRRSLARPDCLRAERKQLVGLLARDGATVLPEGAHLVEPGAAKGRTPIPMLGFVTSSYWSAAMERGFALALIKGGRARHGDVVEAALPGQSVPVEICDPVFYDRQGERQHA